MVDEDELNDLLNAIDRLDDRLHCEPNLQEHNEVLSEQLRDENYHRVPGCYRTTPASTYG